MAHGIGRILSGKTARLAGIGVWVTRPIGQANTLARYIEEEGGHAISLPLIAIADMDDRGPILALMDRLNDFDLAIFVSANAVRKGIDYIGGTKNWPIDIRIATIGKATAKALEEIGLFCTFEPAPPYNSESLLALPELQAEIMADKPVIIFRGVGGRALLGETLAARGARVEYAEVYRRSLPPWVGTASIPWDRIEVIVLTSGEGIQNLFAIANNQEQERLRRTPLVVIGERMARLVERFGDLRSPIIASNASDAAILDALCTWNANRKGFEYPKSL
uniref:Uroporphyrinogen-III synthase n=1 Tax=Candidatus Kentrum sp. SD TaxID=2126332 RepID=A0A451BN41_9GAMM|nr:MAG: uroporphyrinogen-III synthase [Candidatus Kentron sp. SD]VFK42239.1 MAG: uroporphyrinogen-III synthase [Candidatus Kentron sp. SD]VFK79678.1 MAG: uroporphyrinogen-III synthase [Candidatus Kentron sp. SD]